MLDTPNQPTQTAAEASEVEWQLDADDLDAIERWLGSVEPHAGLIARPAAQKHIVDHYVDTADLRLYAAGFAARLRGANGKSEATLKSIVSNGDAESGLRRRLELNEPVRYALLHSLAGARGVVGARIRQHAAVRELRVLFTVRTDRRTAIVASSDGVDIAEVALDDTTIEAGDRTTTLRRVEVEALVPGVEDQLASFVERLRDAHDLEPGTSSKFGGGLGLAVEAGLVTGEVPTPGIPEEMRVSAPPSKQAPTPSVPLPPPSQTPAAAAAASQISAPAAPLPKDSLAALVRDVIATQLAAVRDNEAGTRLGEDVEALHDMRVAVRRLRTAFRLFAKVLPSVAGPSGPNGGSSDIDAALRWLAAELGVVRDLDVQLERIEEWRQTLDPEDANSLDALAELLHGRRDAARLDMVAALDTPRLQRLYSSLEALAAAGREDVPRRALKPAPTQLPRILKRQQRALDARVKRIQADRDAPATLLHETRIRAKRLRYAAEFATPVYGKRAGALVSALKRAQDVLGLHQDAEVAIADLRALSREAGATLPPQTLFAMGEIAQRYRQSQQAQRDALPPAVARVRRRWRRLRSRLDHRREDT